MTPEETVNLEIWEILQDLKEESLVPEEDGTFFYDTTRTVIAAGSPSPTIERKWAVVRKFAREKALEIVREIEPDWRATRNGFYLKILQPKFDEVYAHFQQLSRGAINTPTSPTTPDEGIKYIEPKINDTPVKIVISDLKSLYQEIDHEQNKVQFFIKIAHYGKYILENQSTIKLLAALYQEAQDDTNIYTDAWKDFINIWKQYSTDLIEKAEQAGIKDDPNNPLAQEIRNIKQRLSNEDALIIESDLESYFLPYQTLIWKFGKINKYNLIEGGT